MPLNRYQIRNEYSLADPELYKVADKDDPEALLEGVAMAGLVGVLRQLGDLAEFAAEIFHDLHEEVMATASRSHGLIVRVQQLEAEFPSIERTLLSQTSHTSFLYNSGIDWHPNLRMDQSLVTQGDLPRFVMDSYEECRGPPRLFLLDKFDVAGAGACLKRFTDPSFFKINSTLSNGRKLEGQREKKTRRVKKRGPRWRNGDTPESFPSSHAKLHQLFLEERIESGVNDPARRVKLKKRQFTGSLFDQDNVRSYMEKFLDTGPQEQKKFHEICIDPLALTWTSDNVCEAGLEIVEIGAMSPVKESIRNDRSLCSSPDARETVVKSSITEYYEASLNLKNDRKSMEVPGLNHETHGHDMKTIQKMVNGEDIADRESKSEVSVDEACDFDDGASEIENYVDALANIESEVETDSECKKFPRYMNHKPAVADSDGSERQRELQSVSMDSQSVGNSATSDDGYMYSEERQSSSCSNSVNTVTETTPGLDTAVMAVPTTQAFTSDSVNMCFDHHSTSEEILRKEREKHVAASTDHFEGDDILKSEQEFGEALNASSPADLNKKAVPVDMEASLKKNPSTGSEWEDPSKRDAVVGETDRWHANQTAMLPFHKTFSDAMEDSGNHFSVEPSIRDNDDQNSSVYSDTSHGPSNSSYGLLVEGHDYNLREAVNACSDSGPPSKHLPVSDPTSPEKTNSIYVTHEHLSVPSTEVNSRDLYSFSNSAANIGIQELLPGKTNPCRTSSLDFAVGDRPCSSEDPNIEDSTAVSKERESSASLVDQAGRLPDISNQLQSCTQEFSSSETTDTEKVPECGPLEADIAVAASSREESNSVRCVSANEKIADDFLLVQKQSPLPDPLETQHEWLNIPSEAMDTIQEDEARKQYPGNDTCMGCSVSVDDDGAEAALHAGLLDMEPVCQDSNSTYPEETKVFELDSLVVDPVSQAATSLGEASVHATADQHGDEDLIISRDASPLSIPFKHDNISDCVLVAENGSDLVHNVDKVEHIATVADDHHHNGIPLSSSLISFEESLPGASLASENSSEHLKSASSHQIHLQEVKDLDPLGYELLKAHHVERKETAGVAALHYDNQPVMSKNSLQSTDHTLETSSEVFHGNGMLNAAANQATQVENSGQPPHQQSIPDLGMRPAEPQINLEPPSLPPLPPMQWRLGRFQNSAAAPPKRQMVQHTLVPVQVQPMSLTTMHHTMAPVQSMTVPAVHHSLASFQPVTLAAGTSTLASIPPGALPTALPAVHYTIAPLQPVTPPISNYGTETIARTFTSEGQLGHIDGYVTQQGIFKTPMPVSVTDSFFEINTSTVERQNNLPSTVPLTISNSDGYETQQGMFTPPMPVMVPEVSSNANTSITGRQDNLPFVASLSSLRSMNGTQIFEESFKANVDQPESGSSIEGGISEHISTVEAQGIAETAIRNELHGLGSQVSEKEAVNSYVQPIFSSTVDQPSPGLAAPEAGITWSSAYDAVPTHADANINGTFQKKPPRPRNPLIDEVVAIDKSKFRKVERTKPQLESKSEEGESLLEQMQLRKVERNKPPVESKVEAGEYLLEQLQLRKVGGRVKPPVEQKAEEKEFSLEQLQLRKVGERVKPSVEPKSEEREFLLEQLHLRKVGEKTKQEVEPKVEETGSPLAQLRKVKERVREEAEPKAEETESPRVQLRKVRERVREELELKAEETESPRMQLRKVAERAHPLIGEKPEERDSLFEQIRNKSFSLKPAVVTRPNIQGPRTNLNVAAILEKASTIRQAMAGSDEDDDDGDSWSDS